MSDQLASYCPACGSVQIQLNRVDRKRPERDILKCRTCKVRAPRSQWYILMMLRVVFEEGKGE